MLLEFEGEVAADVDGEGVDMVGGFGDAAGDGVADDIVDEDVEAAGGGKRAHPIEGKGSAAVGEDSGGDAGGGGLALVQRGGAGGGEDLVAPAVDKRPGGAILAAEGAVGIGRAGDGEVVEVFETGGEGGAGDRQQCEKHPVEIVRLRHIEQR
jgi:hypothetical protein